MVGLVLLLTLASPDCNTISYNVETKDGIKYMYYTKEINGECVLDGLWTEYFVDNGEIRLRGNYKNNVKDGHWFYNYHSGSRQMQGGYKNDVEDGYWIFFHKNGKRFMEGPYCEGGEQC